MHTCSMSLRQAVVSFCVFSLENSGSPKTQIPQKHTKQKYTSIWGQKIIICKGLAGALRTRLPNFRVYLRKTAWALDAKQIEDDVHKPAYNNALFTSSPWDCVPGVHQQPTICSRSACE